MEHVLMVLEKHSGSSILFSWTDGPSPLSPPAGRGRGYSCSAWFRGCRSPSVRPSVSISDLTLFSLWSVCMVILMKTLGRWVESGSFPAMLLLNVIILSHFTCGLTSGEGWESWSHLVIPGVVNSDLLTSCGANSLPLRRDCDCQLPPVPVIVGI